jgi:hypothetical protein
VSQTSQRAGSPAFWTVSERRNVGREDPMYDPQLDERSSRIGSDRDGKRGRLHARKTGQLAMSHAELKPEAVGRFALGCACFSMICAALVAVFPQVSWMRGISGSLGFNAGCWGAGVAIWCSIRLRERLCYFAAVLSIPNLAFWGWFLIKVIHIKI